MRKRPPIPQMGPPPEVIFSDPADGEIDVPLRAPIRLQFSREMNPETFKDHVRWTFTTADSVSTGAGTPREAERIPSSSTTAPSARSRSRLTLNDSAVPHHHPRAARRHRRDRRREAEAVEPDASRSARSNHDVLTQTWNARGRRRLTEPAKTRTDCSR